MSWNKPEEQEGEAVQESGIPRRFSLSPKFIHVFLVMMKPSSLWKSHLPSLR